MSNFTADKRVEIKRIKAKEELFEPAISPFPYCRFDNGISNRHPRDLPFVEVDFRINQPVIKI